MLSQIPGMRLTAPRDAVRLRDLLGAAVADEEGPTAVGYPSGIAPEDIPAFGHLGTADLLTPADTASEVLLVPVGGLAAGALDAAAKLRDGGVAAAVADPRWIVPVDPALTRAASRYRLVVTIEDNAASGGFGDAFARSLRAVARPTALLTLALADGFASAADRAAVHRHHGLDAEGIARQVQAELSRITQRQRGDHGDRAEPRPSHPRSTAGVESGVAPNTVVSPFHDIEVFRALREADTAETLVRRDEVALGR